VEVADSVTVGVTIDLSVQSSDEMFSIYGGISDDKITGGLGEDHIFAGDGNDTIYGLAGEDYVDGGNDSAGDILMLATLSDADNASFASDAQIENIEIINLFGDSDGASIDLHLQTEGFTVIGSGSDDTIVGSNGSDAIYGAEGDDLLTGSDGNDTFYVEFGTDTITDLSDGDAFVVSASDATVTADVGDFDATSETSNMGTAYINGGFSDDTLIDMSDAMGPNGYNLDGGSDDTFGNDTLIGSDFDDVINGGNSAQVSDTAVDVMTGNGGADLFVFDTFNSTPATMSVSDSTSPVDQETIDVTSSDGNTDGGTETITVAWTINGVNQTAVVISASAFDSQSDASIEDAIVQYFDGREGSVLGVIYPVQAAIVAGKVVLTAGGPTATTDDFVNLEITSVTPTAATGWVGGSFTLDEGSDTEQVSMLRIGTGPVTEGEVYSFEGALADGTNFGSSYEALLGSDAEDIAIAFADYLNASGVSDSIDALVSSDAEGWFVEFTDLAADDGGFTLSGTSVGAFDKSGASGNPDVLTLDVAFADVITDFNSDDDTISFGLDVGTAGNFDVSAAVSATYAAAFADAAVHMNGAVKYFFAVSPADNAGLLFVDANNDQTIDSVVKLTGVTNLSGFDFGNIV
jgi:hypothetical protein